MLDCAVLSSVANAFRVVDLLAERGELGVSEIGRRLDLTTATAHRLVSTLVGTGLVERNPDTRRYRLGTKILVLAQQVRGRLGVRDALRPMLEKLAADTNETVNLGVLRDGDIVYLEKIDSNELFRIEIQVGAKVPAYCTGLGKAILASLPADELGAYLTDLKPTAHTPATITSKRRLKEELDAVRKQGYAVDRGELLADVWCVAVPIVDADGRPVAALSVSAPRSRFEARSERFVRAALRHAADASEAVAGFGPPDGRIAL